LCDDRKSEEQVRPPMRYIIIHMQSPSSFSKSALNGMDPKG